MLALDLQTFYSYVAHSAHKGRQDWLSPPCGFPRAAWHLGRKPVAFTTSDDSQGFPQIPFRRYHCCQCEWVTGDPNALAVLCCHVGRRAQPHHQPWTFQLAFKSSNFSQIVTAKDFLEKITQDSLGQYKGLRRHWQSPLLPNPKQKQRKKTSGSCPDEWSVIKSRKERGKFWDLVTPSPDPQRFLSDSIN